MIEANWPLIDFCLRGGATSLFVFGAIGLARAPRSYASRLGLVLMLSAAMFVLDGVPAIEGFPPLDWFMNLGSALVIPIFWLFAGAWFDDDYRPSGVDAAIVIAFVTALLLQDAGVGGRHFRVANAFLVYGTGSALAGHAIWLAWRDRKTDLVEARSKVRAFFVVAVALTIVWALWSEAANRFATPLAWLSFANAAMLLALGLGLNIALFGLAHPETFPDPTARSSSETQPQHKPRSTDEVLDPVLAARLDHLMTFDRLYRNPDLTIGQLAVRLDTSEHRLRRMINRGLGFRNFNEFLNARRVAEVKAALCDAGQAEVAILTIALDAGFGSLPAFNRAFKVATGETPRDFRRRGVRPD